jgi:hypothetical protein
VYDLSRCHEGTCHVGITTHVKTREEAEIKGFKSFRPFHEKGSSDLASRVSSPRWNKNIR